MKNNYNIITKNGIVELYRNGALIHRFCITPRKNEHDPKHYRTYSHFDVENNVILFYQNDWSKKNIINKCYELINQED